VLKWPCRPSGRFTIKELGLAGFWLLIFGPIWVSAAVLTRLLQRRLRLAATLPAMIVAAIPEDVGLRILRSH